jgi:hypothetical protein
MDLNPVLAFPEPTRTAVVDARIRIDRSHPEKGFP